MPNSPPAIQIRPHPSKHRALHATRPLRAGQTIHIFASPLLLHPTRAHLSSVCTHCLRPAAASGSGSGSGSGAGHTRPRACSRCHAAFYCDDSCQRAGWTAIHGLECKALRGNKSGGDKSATPPAAELPTPVRALLQALLKKDIADGLAGLEGHVDARRRTGGRGWADVEMMAVAACAFALGGKETGGDVRRAIEMLCKVGIFFLSFSFFPFFPSFPSFFLFLLSFFLFIYLFTSFLLLFFLYSFLFLLLHFVS